MKNVIFFLLFGILGMLTCSALSVPDQIHKVSYDSEFAVHKTNFSTVATINLSEVILELRQVDSDLLILDLTLNFDLFKPAILGTSEFREDLKWCICRKNIHKANLARYNQDRRSNYKSPDILLTKRLINHYSYTS